MKCKLLIFFLLIGGFFVSMPSNAQKIRELFINVDKPETDIQPTMWGIFFEGTNFAADDGIYAELVKNPSFEFSRPSMGWRTLNPVLDPYSFLVIRIKILQYVNFNLVNEQPGVLI